MNINMVYVPFHVGEGQLGAAIKGAYGLNVLGMNVTVPYKNDVIQYLVDIDSMAKNIGAVNTLVRIDGGYKGYNTDITGLKRAMESDGVSVGGESVIILGAGGVGRAVTFMCASSGAKRVYLLNRNVDKAKNVADEVNGKLGTDSVVPMPISDYMKLVEGGGQKYLVIQATSVGLAPNVNDVVIDDEKFYKCIKAGYDLIYNPWETRFMRLVRENGGQAYNGLKMLLYQGIDAFELWNGCHVSDESAFIIYKKLMDKLR
jgi:shikimate dehydrogenase